MTTDVLLVGLDAGDASLVANLADAGELPVLAGLRAAGLRADLAAVEGLGDDAAWSSFATGVGPGRHGRWFHRHYRLGTYELVQSLREEIASPPFWDVLAAHGRRVAVIDVPKAPIGSSDQNLVISDWMSHGGHMPAPQCRPTNGWASLLAPWLEHESARWRCEPPGPTAELVAALSARAARRADCTVEVMRRAPWDAVVVAFGEMHCAGHLLWGDDALTLVYRAVDEQCGRIIDAAGRDCTVVVFSLLGMGPDHPTAELADAVLDRLDGHSTELPSARARRVHTVRARVPRRVRRRLPGRLRAITADARARDFGRRRFWRVPSDLMDTPVRCNVIGREPYGRVAPGAELSALCDELSRELLALVEPTTGRRLVRDVVVPAQRYPGEAPDNFADLLVVWDRTQPLRVAASPTIGEVHADPVSVRPGEHRAGGFVLASGPGVAPGRIPEPVAAVDLAPTVARLLDVPFSGDGRSIPGITSRAGARDQAAVGSMLNDDQRSA